MKLTQLVGIAALVLALPVWSEAHERKSAWLVATGLAAIAGGVYTALWDPPDVERTIPYEGTVTIQELDCRLRPGVQSRQNDQVRAVSFDGFCRKEDRWRFVGGSPGQASIFAGQDHEDTIRGSVSRPVDGAAVVRHTVEVPPSRLQLVGGAGMIVAGSVLAILGARGDSPPPLKVSASRSHVRADYSVGF